MNLRGNPAVLFEAIMTLDSKEPQQSSPCGWLVACGLWLDV